MWRLIYLILCLTFFRTLGCDRRVIRQHIDAYFEYIYPVPIFSFLHRAELLSQFTAATIYPALLLAICGLSARFMTPSKERGTQAKSWIELAEKIVFRDFGKINIANVQTLMLLELHQMYDHRNSKCFLYLALAVRVAYSLKLHKEDRQLSFLEQESRRRLLWCMFALDRLHAGGVPVSAAPCPLGLQMAHQVRLVCKATETPFESQLAA